MLESHPLYFQRKHIVYTFQGFDLLFSQTTFSQSIHSQNIYFGQF